MLERRCLSAGYMHRRSIGACSPPMLPVVLVLAPLLAVIPTPTPVLAASVAVALAEEPAFADVSVAGLQPVGMSKATLLVLLDTEPEQMDS